MNGPQAAKDIFIKIELASRCQGTTSRCCLQWRSRVAALRCCCGTYPLWCCVNLCSAVMPQDNTVRSMLIKNVILLRNCAKYGAQQHSYTIHIVAFMYFQLLFRLMHLSSILAHFNSIVTLTCRSTCQVLDTYNIM